MVLCRSLGWVYDSDAQGQQGVEPTGAAVLNPPGGLFPGCQPADSNAVQVVKSLDTNLNLGDHNWEHQTHVAEAPMQEWPMTTAGMKGARRSPKPS